MERSRGQALVEFALVAPLLILLLLSIIEFGRAVYYIQMLDNAAREGARYAIVHGAASGCPSGPMPTGPNACDPGGAYVEDTVKRYAIAIIDSNDAAFTVVRKWCPRDEPDCASQAGLGNGDNGRGQQAYVEVHYTFHSFLSTYLPIPTFNLTGRTTLVVNH
jgi:TadE-like protein